MEEYSILMKESLKLLNTADHMAYMTYPMLDDPKLLITITQNLYNALMKSVEAILIYERTYKRIPGFTDSYNDKMHMFRETCMDKYDLSREGFLVLKDLREILEEHRKSNVEFRRKNEFVICSDNFRLKTLSLVRIKDLIYKSKPFIEKANRIIGRRWTT